MAKKRGPLIIIHTFQQWVRSEIRLFVSVQQPWNETLKSTVQENEKYVIRYLQRKKVKVYCDGQTLRESLSFC